MANIHIVWVQPLSHLPGVVAAPEPDRGGIGLLLGLLLSYSSASQNLVTFPNGSLLLGPLEAKGDIMRKPLGGMVGGPGPIFSPFH
jgi:hypothetical protein